LRAVSEQPNCEPPSSIEEDVTTIAAEIAGGRMRCKRKYQVVFQANSRITIARHVLDETKQVRFALSYFSDLENLLETLLLGRVSDLKESAL